MSAGYRSVVDREVSEKMNGPYVAGYDVFGTISALSHLM
jgi:hypothetical protein